MGRLKVNVFLQVRSETITTYALCGFANIGSIGVALGGLGAMAPTRKSDLADLAIRALIAGTTACFISACIAGELHRTPFSLAIVKGWCPLPQKLPFSMARTSPSLELRIKVVVSPLGCTQMRK